MKICPQCGTEYELDQRFCPKDGSTLRSQSNASGDLLGQIIADRYHVLKKLGEGGMGTVYLAEHVKMGRKSAVKVMNPGMVNDADAISRFNREAANASRINHPNVAAVYDFGETSDGLIYLAMEFIEGPSLTKVIEDAVALTPQRAADITRQASEALAVAHDMGIVHRDLKPDNIMLTTNRDGSDCVKVVDFGIAKAAGNENQKVTKTGMVVGTPEYMSPEQLAGDVLDGRSDTYSLALVAFNMLTGKLPFPAETLQESMIMRLTDRPKQLAEMKTDVIWAEGVQAVLDKALARSVADRYQTASEFGRELTKAVAAMPRTSAATRAFTEVIAPPVVPAAKAPTPADAIPRTRIGTPTPAKATPHVPATPSGKSRTPLIAGGLAGTIAIIAVGAWMALKNGDAATATPQGGTQLNQPVATLPPTVAPPSLAARFEEVERLTDISRNADAVSARAAMAKLDSMALVAQSDSDKVHLNIVRAEAHLLMDQVPLACSILKDNEGKAAKSQIARLIQRSSSLLKAAC